MFWTLFVAFFVAWLVAYFAFHVVSGLIHLLLLAAVVMLIIGLARRAP